jgi:hypothetical protein
VNCLKAFIIRVFYNKNQITKFNLKEINQIEDEFNKIEDMTEDLMGTCTVDARE